MKSRIKAFTLLEMVVVILLSTIIIAVAYQGYILFYRQFLAFRERSEVNLKLAQMDTRLFADVADCKEIRKSSKGLVFIFKDKQIVYTIEDTIVIRYQEAMIDTFRFHAPEITIQFGGKSVFENDLVDEIKIETKRGENPVAFIYRKKYGADIIINNPKLQ